MLSSLTCGATSLKFLIHDGDQRLNISVFGAGAWGTALAVHAACKHSVILWCRDALQAKQMQQDRINTRYLPGVRLPDNLRITSDWQEASSILNRESVAVIATPLSGLSQTLKLLSRLSANEHGQSSTKGEGGSVGSVSSVSSVSAGLVIANLAKGIEPQTYLLPHQIAQRDALNCAMVSLSGPSFAAEVASGLPAALAAAGSDSHARQRVIDAFHHQSMRVYGTGDVVGVELAAALKNVIAIAAGACDGLALGFNARAALITRGLSEITNIGLAMGARAETFQGLAGFGDLVLTCTGSLSRNRQVGLLLAEGRPLAEITASLGHVAEGVACAAAAQALAIRLGVDAPIIDAVNQVLFDQLPASQAVASLLGRAQKNELS